MLDYLHAGYKNYVQALFTQKLLARHTPALQDIGNRQLHGYNIIITGPTSGIGWETAAELARRGAHVVLACRSQSKGDAMMEQLAAAAKQAGQAAPSLEVSLLDLASLASVEAFVQRWEQQQRPLHILINNAGMFNMGAGRAETPDGIEMHMQTNHLSHFLLTLGLLPALQRGAQQPPQQPTSSSSNRAPAGPQEEQFRPRIVSVASAMHFFGYSFGPDDPLQKQNYSTTLAYGNSKLAQILFTAELNRRLSAGGVPVDALCLHPGNVLTEVVRSLPALIQRLYRATLTHVLFTPQEGSRATVFAATDPNAPQLAASTGSYLDAHAEPTQPSRRAGDKQLAAWVWDWSKGQVQLPDAWDVAAA